MFQSNSPKPTDFAKFESERDRESVRGFQKQACVCRGSRHLVNIARSSNSLPERNGRIVQPDIDARRGSARNFKSGRVDLVKKLSAVLIAVALLAGIGLRVTRLDKVPPALAQDEACDGYDAYSILKTGRDHHGNFMPIVMQGFNDYRMPLFQYSLVPLGVFGLKAAVVRLGAAIWGIVDMVAITIVAGLMFGWAGAAAAAILVALMRWHLELSRYGSRRPLLRHHQHRYGVLLHVAAATQRFLAVSQRLSFGLSLYTYAITKPLVPPLLGLIAILYWRELKQARIKAVAWFLSWLSWLYHKPRRSSATVNFCRREYRHLSLFSPDSICTGCDSEQTRQAMNSIPYLLIANFCEQLYSLIPFSEWRPRRSLDDASSAEFW